MRLIDRKLQKRVEEAAQWIKNELEKRGIKVHQAKEKLGYVRVYVRLRVDQHYAYREIYRQAIELFPGLGRNIICDDADHPELLQGL